MDVQELYETGYAHLHASIDQGFGFLRGETVVHIIHASKTRITLLNTD